MGGLVLRDSTDTQHLMFNEIMGKYHPKMAEIMADDVPGEPKAVLDLGCGSGMWLVPILSKSTSPLLNLLAGLWMLQEISPTAMLWRSIWFRCSLCTSPVLTARRNKLIYVAGKCLPI